MNVLLLYFFLVNSMCFILAGYDKRMAIKRKRRIPENTLFTVAFVGGSIGLLTAMLLFTHKTSKTSFIVKFSMILLLQIALVYLKLTDKI
ncbi:DUF1294 domain-containing protein [Flavobacterium hercynium]|uniref:DUF1294 domain-containing protein n=1 Tax=Flavobacterium hercynium TaxID=387094 RepID=A0A226GS44_9FLAO|nr:DUF1294 domain-containing protein [Flavobacterium hercynium]OXA84494.1 hypothetical protein B0A66_20965 [Flavobacterium hercynium]SMP07359.1 Uncharacterized membrane protein YsdA, DUF1294 family [Flavobacterium hercynium]